MDDQGKRLVVALVLSFAFLFVYQRYILPPAPVEVEEATQGTEEKTTLTPAPEISSAPEGEAGPYEPLKPISATDEKIINISTPLYQARLSNRGGAISSFKLVNYRQDIKDPESHVEMVRVVEEGGLHPMAAEFVAAGGPLGFSQALFQVEGADLSLEAGQSDKIVFRYRTTEGLEMVKTLTFSADTYNVECSVKLHNRSDQILRGRTTLVWAPGLEPPTGGKKSSMFSASRYGYQGALYYEGSGRPDKLKAKKLEGQKNIEGPFTWIAS
ncbi:membrane protein insertase YidC, partial [bacterium]|nr:membrane protein insertase YidC [bacterium]